MDYNFSSRLCLHADRASVIVISVLPVLSFLYWFSDGSRRWTELYVCMHSLLCSALRSLNGGEEVYVYLFRFGVRREGGKGLHRFSRAFVMVYCLLDG